MKTIKLITKTVKEPVEDEQLVDVTYNYYISSLSKDLYNEIKSNHNKNSELLAKIPINLKGIELIGELGDKNNVYKIRDYMDFFTQSDRNPEIHYRDYCQPLKKQRDRAWIINMCSNFQSSWNTVLIALNKPKYCVIWKDIKDKKYDNVRPF